MAKHISLANAESEWNKPDLPRVIVAFTEDFVKDYSTKNFDTLNPVFAAVGNADLHNLLDFAGSRNLWLLSSSEDTYWLLLPKAGSEAGPEVIEVPKDDIKFIHIYK